MASVLALSSAFPLAHRGLGQTASSTRHHCSAGTCRNLVSLKPGNAKFLTARRDLKLAQDRGVFNFAKFGSDVVPHAANDFALGRMFLLYSSTPASDSRNRGTVVPASFTISRPSETQALLQPYYCFISSSILRAQWHPSFVHSHTYFFS